MFCLFLVGLALVFCFELAVGWLMFRCFSLCFVCMFCCGFLDWTGGLVCYIVLLFFVDFVFV